ncbi:hypothetical protein LG314_08405 [Agrococcus terreus]|uniref:hypothetical protein n=1 Tax=Agrococcus terreus TaxID=574649 RepID=UPI00384BE3EC
MTTDTASVPVGADAPDPSHRHSARRRVPWWAALLLGVACAALGLLPWLIAGGSLPLQDLWATDAGPDGMPFVLLPLHQEAVVTTWALLTVGAAAAGVAGRALRRRLSRGAVAALGTGIVAAQTAAIVQAATALDQGLRDSFLASLYLAGLVGAAAVSVLVGAVVLALVARAPRGGALLGLAVGAVALAPWLSRLLLPQPALADPQLSTWVLALVPWIPSVLVGVAIAWSGVATVGRAIGAILALGLLWVLPAAITAVQAAAGAREAARDPAALVDIAGDVLQDALLQPAVVVALVVAAVGLIVRALVRRSRSRGARHA